MSTENPNNLIEYAKQHLLDLMRTTGISNEEIEALIIAIPAEHPLKQHFVIQYIGSLPSTEQERARRRFVRAALWP